MLFHEQWADIPEDRPAFVQIVEEPTPPIINGYTLQIDIVDRSASIIILKKGGNKSMLKTVVKALEGFERQFDELTEMKANLEHEKEVAKEIAIAEVERKFEEKSQRIDKVLETVSVTEKVEVPDEVEVVEDTEADEEDVEVSEEVAENGIAF